MERSELFADPLQDVLERENVGSVSGGVSMLSAPGSDGEREVLFCGIDVDLYQLEQGLTVLRRELLRLQATNRTTLIYTVDGQKYEEPLYIEWKQ